MKKKGGNQYEYISHVEDELAADINNLKSYSQSINRQLRDEQKTRSGLDQYLDAGAEALRKTNAILEELLGTRSLFGCNICILFGIVLLVILILLFI